MSAVAVGLGLGARGALLRGRAGHRGSSNGGYSNASTASSAIDSILGDSKPSSSARPTCLLTALLPTPVHSAIFRLLSLAVSRRRSTSLSLRISILLPGILPPLERSRGDRIAGPGPCCSAHLTPLGRPDSDGRGHPPDDRGHRDDGTVKVSAFARNTVRVPSNRCPHSLEFVSALRRAPQSSGRNQPRLLLHDDTYFPRQVPSLWQVSSMVLLPFDHRLGAHAFRVRRYHGLPLQTCLQQLIGVESYET